MKKICLFALVLLLVFSVFSCSNKSDEQEKVPNVQQNSEDDGPLDGDDNSMLVYPKDPKKYVVNYIRDMARSKWTPKETFQLNGKYQAWGYNLTYEEGQTYYGPPFLVDSRGTKQEFENSVVDGVYVGGTTGSTCIGSACYDAVYVTLIQVCPSITFKSTEDMLPGNGTGLVAVGDWDYSASTHDTATLIKANPKDIMGKAYAELEPGDIVLKHIVSQDAGHTRIVSDGPVVYYNSDGTIDMEKSYICTIEQTNQWDKNSIVKTTWWVAHSYTFSALYQTNFVPLTAQDYTADLKDPYITGKDLNTPDNFAKAKKLAGTLTSNHYITEVSYKITNEKGVVIYEDSAFPCTKKVYLEDLTYRPKLHSLKSGTYHFTLTASLSFGTKTMADFDFVLE